jgi:hypothetical protein
MTGEMSAPAERLSMYCSLPALEEFVGLAAAIAGRMAELGGLSKEEAAAAAREVDGVTKKCLADGGAENLEIRFESAEGRLRIRVTHAGASTDVTRALPDA